MNRIAAVWTWLAGQIRGLRVQLRLCLRMTLAAMLAFILSQMLHLPLPLWAVLTAVIVTQMSVGKSLKATLDYLEGTIGGAIYSGVIGALIPHSGTLALLLMLALAIAPLALLAATSSRFATAPFTAVMVLLLPTITHMNEFDSALYRVIEVALGCAVALSVSVFVLPERAHGLVVAGAARMLDLMAQVVPELLAGLAQSRDAAQTTRIQSSIGHAFIELRAINSEAKRERVIHFNADPDPQTLLDTLLRLRHDLVMIGRASIVPFPSAFLARLKAPITKVGETAAAYLRASGGALTAHQGSPSLVAFEAALDAYAEAFAAARREGLTRELSADAAERIFALSFALEQLHLDFSDLQRCVSEFDRSPGGASQKPDRIIA